MRRFLLLPNLLPVLLAVLPPVLLLAACAGSKQVQLPELPQPPVRLEMFGSSFMPPAEAGWRVAGRDGDHLVLGRQGPSPEETEIIKAGTTYTQIFHSDAAFEAFIRDRIAGDIGAADRFSVRHNEMTMLRQGGNDCARVHLTVVDRQTQQGGKGAALVSESIELVCRHPDNDGVVSYLSYAQHYYPGDKVADFDSKAAQMLQSLELYPF